MRCCPATPVSLAFTNLAGETYVTMAQRDGKRLVAVLMYSQDDVQDQARAVLDWGFSRVQ